MNEGCFLGELVERLGCPLVGFSPRVPYRARVDVAGDGAYDAMAVLYRERARVLNQYPIAAADLDLWFMFNGVQPLRLRWSYRPDADKEFSLDRYYRNRR